MTKIGVITGGTKGIGKALVHEFVSQGFTIITCSRHNKDILNLIKESEEINNGEKRVLGIQADLELKEECEKFIQFVLGKTDRLDLLINNAGVFVPGKVTTEAAGVFEKTIQTNLVSPYYITRGLFALMGKNTTGHIFNMCSVASIRSYDNGGSYSISKFGLLGFTKALREELKHKNIKVTAVLPGATFTPSWEGSGLDESRFMKVSDVAKTISSAFNLSENAVVEEILIRPQSGDI